MLKRLFNYLSARKGTHEPYILPREKHTVSRRNISHNALKVIQRLNESGHESYLVGGGVRDLLLGGHPKDFDVATDATPEQIRALFRNSRIIGRRFRIVHVRFGREIIEVTTFRSHHEERKSSSQDSKQSESGMLLRDNVYGDVRSDAARRDFTINALYYCPKTFSIHDYTDGMKDIKQRRLNIIGDPATRYKEDPVRMLRAIRFAAKLGFTLTPETESPIQSLANLLDDIPSARLWDESLKLLMSGSATATFELLLSYDLFRHLFPGPAQHIATDHYQLMIQQGMTNTDKRIRNNKRVTPAFIFAVLLWPVVEQRMRELVASGLKDEVAIQQAGSQAISQQVTRIGIPKRFQITMKEIWELQLRLPKRFGKRAQRLLEHPRFRAAYDFLLLREDAGEQTGNLGAWWTDFQSADAVEQEAMVERLGPEKTGGKTRRRRRRKPSGQKAEQPSVQESRD